MAQVSIKTHAVSDIKSKLLRPAQTSIYTVQFSLPYQAAAKDRQGFRDFFQSRLGSFPDANSLYDKVGLLCNEASLPGSTLSTHEINNDYTGVTERHAYRRLYDDRIDFTFYVDAKEYFIIRLIDAWLAYITIEYQGSANGVPSITDSSYNYRVNFPNNYYTESLTVTKFEKHFGKEEPTSIKYNFVHSYPISINSIPVSYDQSDLLKCTVSFNYSRYFITPYKAYNPSTSDKKTTPQPSTDSDTPSFLNMNRTNSAIYNDFLNIGNPRLDQFGIRDQFGRGFEGTVGANILA
jgi:hypothetical protein